MKRAFTVVELLVVIVIIAALAWFLKPIINNPEPGRRTACLSNLKQLGQAQRMYASDYDEHLPLAEKWMTRTMPFLRSPQDVFICPTAHGETPKALSHYAMNSRLSEKSLKKLAEPAYQALIYDSTRTDWDATDPGQTFAPRHSRGERHLGNLVYADGHAKLVSVDDFTKAVQ